MSTIFTIEWAEKQGYKYVEVDLTNAEICAVGLCRNTLERRYIPVSHKVMTTRQYRSWRSSYFPQL
ncbi:MAG: hypothetical protein PHR53_02520 [Bacteroidales bacterium]|nr:hypothetical protein [Bacteroidales bacterium]